MTHNPPPRPVESGCSFTLAIIIACSICGYLAWEWSGGNRWISSGSILVVGVLMMAWGAWSNR